MALGGFELGVRKPRWTVAEIAFRAGWVDREGMVWYFRLTQWNIFDVLINERSTRILRQLEASSHGDTTSRYRVSDPV